MHDHPATTNRVTRARRRPRVAASRTGCSCLVLLSVCTTISWAEVVRFEITERTPLAEGAAFGDVGPYERMIGRVHFAIRPDDPHNQAIIDLSRAARNKAGLVEFSSDLFILAPRDLGQANRAALYDVNNRGNKLALKFFNDAGGGNDAADPGNGFLMRQGYVVVWSGWDGELLPGDGRLQLHAPVAGTKQTPLTGLVRYEISVDAASTRENVNRANHGAYRPSPRGFDSATLTWRLRTGDRRVPIPRHQFTLHALEVGGGQAGQLPRVDLELTAGFRPGYLYELIYEAEQPLVHGVCFAAVRDLMSALKHGVGEQHPLLLDGKPIIERCHGFGVSQSGRFLREFLYSGFNADEQGRQVFDGLLPHVAGGGLGSFNHRFAQPTAYATQHQLADWPTDRFPFAYETQEDPLSKQRDGILARAVADQVVPKVMHTQSSTEYWTRAGSLVHTDPLGRRDASLPADVRVYAFGGTQHGPASFPPSAGIGQELANPGDYRPLLRGLLSALDPWCREGKPPPPSVYPTLADGTLTFWRQTSTRFPPLPGVRYPEVIREPDWLELGPRWLSDGVIDEHPPRPRGRYNVLVPACGADGNEVGCLSPPEVAVPLATFTGWNLRRAEPGPQNELVGLNGSYIPFARTAADRAKTGDPRLSLVERYADADGYLRKLKRACELMVEDRYLLAEDLSRILDRLRPRAASAFQ